MCKNKCEIPFAFRVCFNFKFDCAKFEISYPPKAVARAVIAGGGGGGCECLYFRVIPD